MKKPYAMTVADFKVFIWDQIKDLPETDVITFGQSDLSFYRMKRRGDHVINLEFNQIYSVTDDPEDV